MIILKIIGSLFVVGSCSLMGFYISNEAKMRIQQLLEFKKYMILLQGDIRYASTPLPEAVHRLALRAEGVFREFFGELSERLMEYRGETFSDIWNELVKEYLKLTSLQAKDISAIQSLGDTIGYLDKELQMNTFELFLSQLEQEIRSQQDTIAQKTKMYNCMGVMAGVFITILLL